MIDTHGRIILLRPIDSVREMIICGHPIKLGCGLIHICRPRFTSIKRYLRSAIICNDHSLIILRVNPKVMMVTMRGI